MKNYSLTEFVLNLPEFKEMYEFTQLNLEIVNKLNEIPKKFSLTVFASGSCQFCKIYIPQLLKIFEFVHFQMEFIAWDECPEEETIELMDLYELMGLPTIIVYDSKKKEVGRITKEPVNSLEEDLLSIAQKI